MDLKHLVSFQIHFGFTKKMFPNSIQIVHSQFVISLNVWKQINWNSTRSIKNVQFVVSIGVRIPTQAFHRTTCFFQSTNISPIFSNIFETSIYIIIIETEDIVSYENVWIVFFYQIKKLFNHFVFVFCLNNNTILYRKSVTNNNNVIFSSLWFHINLKCSRNRTYPIFETVFLWKSSMTMRISFNIPRDNNRRSEPTLFFWKWFHWFPISFIFFERTVGRSWFTDSLFITRVNFFDIAFKFFSWT